MTAVATRAGDALRARFIAETEQTINALRERKLALLQEAEEVEAEETDARKTLRLLKGGT